MSLIKNEFDESGFLVCNSQIFDIEDLSVAYHQVKSILGRPIFSDIPLGHYFDVGIQSKTQRVTQVHLMSDAIYRLITESPLGELAAKITGAKSIKVWGTQLYLKPASDSKAVQIGFHRDSEHVNCFSKGMLTAWIPLNRMQKNSGMIQFVRGSHKWPVEFKNTHAGFSDIFTQRRLLMEETGELDWDERIAQVELGGLSFHHGDVVHASGLNLSGKDRCVLTVGLITDETIFIKKNDSYGLEEILDDPVSCPQIYKRN